MPSPSYIIGRFLYILMRLGSEPEFGRGGVRPYLYSEKGRFEMTIKLRCEICGFPNYDPDFGCLWVMTRVMTTDHYSEKLLFFSFPDKWVLNVADADLFKTNEKYGAYHRYKTIFGEEAPIPLWWKVRLILVNS